MPINWVSAFIDIPDRFHARSTEFWRAVTGSTMSESRGDHGQFSTIQPAQGDSYLRLQNTGSGGTGVHLDLHVADRTAAIAAVERLGGREHTDYGDVQVMTSPGGMRFCLVDHRRESASPPPQQWAGHSSRIDQVVIDIPPAQFASESAFWTALTGWETSAVDGQGEFTVLTQPGQPLRLLLQELEHPAPITRAHLDLAASDRAAEIERHCSLGATVVRRGEWWTVLTAPGLIEYCISDRHPS